MDDRRCSDLVDQPHLGHPYRSRLRRLLHSLRMADACLPLPEPSLAASWPPSLSLDQQCDWMPNLSHVVQREMAERSCNRNKINRQIACTAGGRETDKEEDRQAGCSSSFAAMMKDQAQNEISHRESMHRILSVRLG
jgi:hypothetical protein